MTGSELRGRERCVAVAGASAQDQQRTVSECDIGRCMTRLQAQAGCIPVAGHSARRGGRGIELVEVDFAEHGGGGR